MSEWEEYKIEDLDIAIIDGDRGVNYPKQEEFFEKEYCLFLNTGNVTQEGFVFNSCNFISRQKDEALRKGKLIRNDIVLTTRGTVGNSAFYSKSIPFENVRINSGMIILRAKNKIIADSYLYQLLKSSISRNQFELYSSGSAQPQLPIKDFKKIKFHIPPLHEQHRIASILSTYDELIENNNRRIAILEQTAEQIYKEWFVRMRFPGYENTEFEKVVPKGWEIKKIDDVTSLITRGIPPKYDETGSSLAINQKCIRDGRVNIELGRRQSKSYPKTKQIKFGDILINSTGEGTLGRVAQIYFSPEKVTVDTHVTIVRANSEINIDYLGYYLLSLQEYFAFMAVGSTNQTELSRNTIKNAKIILPGINLQNKFSELIRPLRLKIENLISKNQNLKQTRDLLLPRLISGKLKVSER